MKIFLLIFMKMSLLGLVHSNHRDPMSGVSCNHMPYWTTGADVYVVEGTGQFVDGSEWSPMIHDGEPSIAGGNPGAPGNCPLDMRFPPGCDLTQMTNQCQIFPPVQNICVCRQTLRFQTNIQPAGIICQLAITPCWITRNGNVLPSPNCLNTACRLGTASLTFTPCPCAFGTVTVCATLIDGREMTGAGLTLGCIPPEEDRSPQQCFNIHVEQVNNCPTWNKRDVTTVEDDVTCGRFATQVSAGCTNEGFNQPHEQDLTWRVTCDNPALFTRIPTVVYRQGDTTADLCYTPAPDMSGCSTCTITLHDTGGTANGGCDRSAPNDVQVCITEVNDPPTFIPGPTTLNVDEDAANSCNPSGCSQSEWNYQNWATNRQVGPGWEVCRATCNPRQFLDRFEITFINPCQEELFTTLPTIDVLTGDFSFTLAQHANTPGADNVQLDVVLWDTGANAGRNCLLINDITCDQPFSNTVRVTIIIKPENDVPSFVPAYLTLQLDEDEDFPGAHDPNWGTNMCIGGLQSGSCADTGCQRAAATKCTTGPCAACTTTQTCPCDNCNELNDPENQNFVWDIVTDNQALFTIGGQPSISITGVLSFTLSDDVNGIARIRVTIKDDGGTFDDAATGNTEELVLTVLPKNDQPIFVIPATYSILRCNPCSQQTVSQFVTNIDTGSTWTDEDLQLLFWDSNPPAVNNNNVNLFDEQPTLLFSTDGRTADLIYTLRPGAFGTSTVTVTLRDDGDSTECVVPNPGQCDPCNGGAAAPRRQSCNLLTRTFTFTVTDENLPPTFSILHPGGDVGVFEDPIPATVTIQNYASHSAGSTQEDVSQTVSYLLSVADTSLFTAAGQPQIDTNGHLTFTPEQNAFGVTTATIRVSDDGVPVLSSATQVVTISIFPVNDPPTFSNPPALPVPPALSYPICQTESGCVKSIPTFATGVAMGPPNEVSQSAIFWQVQCPQHPNLIENAIFSPTTGELSFVLKQGMHTDNQPSACNIILRDDGGVSNNGRDTFTSAFAITVGGNGNAPTFDLTITSVSKKEDDIPFILRQEIVNIIAGVGGVTTATCSSALPEPVVSRCNVDIQSWDVSIELVSQMSGTDPLTIQICNIAGCTSKVLTIDVLPVNDAPVITQPIQTITVFEGTGVTSEVTPVPLSSTAVGDRSFFYRVPLINTRTGPDSIYGQTETTQTTTYSVLEVTSSEIFTNGGVIIDAAGVVSFTTSGTQLGRSDISFIARDNGGVALSGVDTSVRNTFSIDVRRYNTRPSFLLLRTMIAATEVEVDSNMFFSNFISSITKGSYPEESTQILSPVVSCPGEGLPMSECSDIVRMSSLDLTTNPSNPTLSIQLAANRFTTGDCTCSVVLTDNGLQGPPSGNRHQSLPLLFQLSVENINDPPSFISGPNQVTTIDTELTVPGWATQISPGPFETDTAMTFSIQLANPSLIQSVTINTATGDLHIIPASQRVGSTLATVCLKESTQSGVNPLESCLTNTFSITILSGSVRGLPTFNGNGEITVVEDSGMYSSRWGSNMQTGDISDTTRSLANFRLTPRSGSEFFSTAPGVTLDGTLSFTVASDAFGQAIFDVVLLESNGLSSIAQQLVINITPVNDQPMVVVDISNSIDVTVLEDSVGYRQRWCSQISAGADNEDSTTLSIEVSVVDASLFSVQPVLLSDCTLSFTPATNSFGSTVATVVVTDSVLSSSPVQFTIFITPVNDQPTWSILQEVINVEEDYMQSSVQIASAASPGPGESTQLLSVIINYDDPNQLLSEPPITLIDSRSGVVTMTIRSGLNRFGTVVMSVTLKDNGGTENNGLDESVASQITLTVGNRNNPPTVQLSSTSISITEDNQYSGSDWITSYSPGPFEDSQSVSWRVTTVQSALFASQPTVQMASGAQLPTLTIIPSPNQHGSTTITIRATDSDGLFVDVNLELSVMSVNDPPTYSLLTQSVAAIPGEVVRIVAVGDIRPGPLNENAQVLTSQITVVDSSVFSVQPELSVVTGELTFQLSSSVTTDVVISFQLSDDGGTQNGGIDVSESQTITIRTNINSGSPYFELSQTELIVYMNTVGVAGEETIQNVINTQSIRNINLPSAMWTVTASNANSISAVRVVDNQNLFVSYLSAGINTLSISLSDPSTGGMSIVRTLTVDVRNEALTKVQIISNTATSAVSTSDWQLTIARHLNISSSRIVISSVSDDYTGKTTSGSSIVVSVSPPNSGSTSQTLAGNINSGTSAIVAELNINTTSSAACVVPQNSESDNCFPRPATCSGRQSQSICQQLSGCLWISTAMCVPTSCQAQNVESLCLLYPNWCRWSGTCQFDSSSCALLTDESRCSSQSPVCEWSGGSCRAASSKSDGGLPSWVIPVAVVGGVLALIGIAAAVYYNLTKKSTTHNKAERLPSNNSDVSFTPDTSQTTNPIQETFSPQPQPAQPVHHPYVFLFCFF